MIKNIVIGVLVITTLLFAGLYVNKGRPLGAFAGGEILQPVQFRNEVTLGTGTPASDALCNTVSWNPGAVTSSTVATTTIALPSGYAVGDNLIGGFTASSTNSDNIQLVLSLGVINVASGTNVIAQLSMPNNGNLSLNAVTGTLSVCYFD